MSQSRMLSTRRRKEKAKKKMARIAKLEKKLRKKNVKPAGRASGGG